MWPARTAARSLLRCQPMPASQTGQRVLYQTTRRCPVMMSVVQEAPQLPASRRMLQLAQRLGLDLADTLPGHRELLADFFQRVVGVHADAEAHAQHALLARRERGEHARRGLAQVRLDRRVDRQDGVLVLDEIAEV